VTDKEVAQEADEEYASVNLDEDTEMALEDQWEDHDA